MIVKTQNFSFKAESIKILQKMYSVKVYLQRMVQKQIDYNSAVSCFLFFTCKFVRPRTFNIINRRGCFGHIVRIGEFDLIDRTFIARMQYFCMHFYCKSD